MDQPNLLKLVIEYLGKPKKTKFIHVNKSILLAVDMIAMIEKQDHLTLRISLKKEITFKSGRTTIITTEDTSIEKCDARFNECIQLLT